MCRTSEFRIRPTEDQTWELTIRIKRTPEGEWLVTVTERDAPATPPPDLEIVHRSGAIWQKWDDIKAVT